ncbi:MAG TPA: DUF1611 domain-containing protein [Gammaproteobacteria bacterium]|nr:DUF1611 domain-containing protein [Gammaproteobacteria bacterium]
MNITKPYLLFLGDADDTLAVKTATGLYQWCAPDCVGQLRLPSCVPILDLPELTLEQARDHGAKTLVIGVVNRGGIIPDSWLEVLNQAVALELDIASGLHTHLSNIPSLRDSFARNNAQLLEIRHPQGPFPVATGQRRSGQRLLTVGTDCSVGKMYASLALHRALLKQGVATDFRATGQTGILIAGGGVAIDAVVADFISGAAETLSPSSAEGHWDIIEGQGSLFHPSYAGVSLGLLHGSQPDWLVLCHEPLRQHMRGLPKQSLPTITTCMTMTLQAAQLVNPGVQWAGCAINTQAMDPPQAKTYLGELSDELQLPCVDPLRDGVSSIIRRLPLASIQ